ncbi:nematocyst expressed protein 6-like [Actinia tenebrosa]|uniref:Metalloendopeptidase n=1 Tax=Actinia tenebrosa TaxID=6105 RepID=A0A6P8I0J0_ACTTE|nr:nematocyst expressed protein 6-like [Actinia tenebrosa]
MKFLIPLVVLAAVLCFIEAKPIEDGLQLVDGDMLLTKEQKEIFEQRQNGRVRRAALKDRYLWPNGVIFYTFGPSLDRAGRNLAQEAMNHWSSQTCLKFRRRNKENAYIKFQYDGKCRAQVGFTGNAGQKVSLGSAANPCSRGSAIHELGHAIGFFHEHSRPDRDNHVRINFNNIRKGAERNFRKDDGFFVDSRGHDYDYGSIMHYSRYQGNNKANAVVMQPIRGNVEIGQRDGLSEGDIAQTNDMYKCDAQGDSHLKPVEDDEEDEDDEGVKPTPNPNGPKPGEVEE